jgi:hypothetical protein
MIPEITYLDQIKFLCAEITEEDRLKKEIKIKIEVFDLGIYVTGTFDGHAVVRLVEKEEQIPTAITEIEERFKFLQAETERLQAKYGRA